MRLSRSFTRSGAYIWLPCAKGRRPTLPTHLHPLDGEESREIGRESGEHEDDEEPVGSDEGTARERLGRLAAALGRERRQGEPEALLQRELPEMSSMKTFSLQNWTFLFGMPRMIEKFA